MAPLSLLPGVQLTGVQDQAFPQGSDTPEGADWYISDIQSGTFLETVSLKDLIKRTLNCLSLKRFCHVHKTEAAKFHFPVSANLVLFMNTRKAGNVYV